MKSNLRRSDPRRRPSVGLIQHDHVNRGKPGEADRPVVKACLAVERGEFAGLPLVPDHTDPRAHRRAWGKHPDDIEAIALAVESDARHSMPTLPVWTRVYDGE